MVEYWHWHSIHNAIESYWKGVLSHDLRPNRLYKECRDVYKRQVDGLSGTLTIITIMTFFVLDSVLKIADSFNYSILLFAVCLLGYLWYNACLLYTSRCV